MLRENERIHLHNCYNIPDYTFMDYNISDITSKHAEEIHNLTFHSPNYPYIVEKLCSK